MGTALHEGCVAHISATQPRHPSPSHTSIQRWTGTLPPFENACQYLHSSSKENNLEGMFQTPLPKTEDRTCRITAVTSESFRGSLLLFHGMCCSELLGGDVMVTSISAKGRVTETRRQRAKTAKARRTTSRSRAVSVSIAVR